MDDATCHVGVIVVSVDISHSHSQIIVCISVFENNQQIRFVFEIFLKLFLNFNSEKMAAQRSIPQSREVLLKSYNIRLKEDCKIMLENYFGEFYLGLPLA